MMLAAQAAASGFADQVAADEAVYTSTPIALTGRVLREDGLALSGVTVSLVAWGDNADNDGVGMSAASNGTFVLSGLMRRAVLLKVVRTSYYTEIIPLDLQRPLTETTVDLGDIVLYRKRAGRARLTFAGDVMMGRRYFDKDEDGTWGETGDLLRTGSLTADTQALFRFVKDVLQVDDHTVVNLETAVTDDPATPHPTKSFVIYSYPESLSALPSIGIESVSLGNNHIYDYLESGFADTMAALSASGLGWFGAGYSDTLARANRYRPTVNYIPMALQGFNEMVGYNYGDDEVHIVAKDSPLEKGGALHLNDTTMTEFVTAESGTRFTIPVIHGGIEYAYRQRDTVRRQFRNAISGGAGIVIAHHPHYAQGVGTYDAGTGKRFILGSLGNFMFEQEIFETFRSFVAVVDVESTDTGIQVTRLRLIPFRFDGYVPRLLAGEGLSRMARYLGHLSTMESTPGDGIEGAVVFVEDNQILAHAGTSGYTTTEHDEVRTVALSSGKFKPPVEFLPVTPSDSLAYVKTSAAATCEVGRDIMVLGSFEEQDVDDEYKDAERWDLLSNVRYVQSTVAYRGRNAMVISRKSTDGVRSSTWLDSTIEVKPGQKLTVMGYHKGDNAGELDMTVRWMLGDDTVSHTTKYTRAAGTYAWAPFSVDLTVPTGVDGVRVYFRHYPPATSDGRVYLDDISLIEWDARTLDGGAGATLATPNDWGYVRCTATNTTSLQLTLTHRVYQRP